MKTIRLLSTVVLAAGLLPAQPGPPPPPPPVPPARPAMAAPPLPVRAGGSYLGIGVAEIDAERAKALNLTEERGVEVTRVEPGSPAEKAGLKQGDVVLEYQGQRVEGTEQFVRMVRETPPGRQVKLLISRGGATQTITATIGRRKGPPWPGPEFERELGDRLRGFRFEMPDMPHVFMSWRSPMLGVEAESLSSQLAEYFGVKEGVLVRSVIKDSPADRAGIKAGDVITRIDGHSVKTPGEVSARLRSARSKGSFPVTLVRNRAEMTVTVTLPSEPEKGGGEPRPRPVSAGRSFRL